MSEYGQGPQYGQQPPQQGYGNQYQQGPPPFQPQTQALALQPDSGTFQGGTYTVKHRDTNAVLHVDLQQGASIMTTRGALIHMASTVQLSGEIKFSFHKLFSGAQMAESTYAGYGPVVLAPLLQGDIVTLNVDGATNWKIAKHAFLASSNGVVKETTSQGFGKGFLSGEGVFVYSVAGQGLMWLTAYGAVDRIDLQPGEQHIVAHGHLVAWSCDYQMDRGGSGALIGLKTGEGFVCRFTGPGSIYVQTRNREDLERFIRACVPQQQQQYRRI